VVSPAGLWVGLWSLTANAAVLQADNYSTLQAALIAAADGDTILLSAKEYVGPIDIKGKSLTIEGLGDESVIVDAGGMDTVVTINESVEVTLRSLMVDGSDQSRCISVFMASLSLDNVLVANGANPSNDEVAGAGLRGDDAEISILDSAFSSNAAGLVGKGGHIGLAYSSTGTLYERSLTMSGTVLQWGTADYGGALYAEKGISLAIDSSSFGKNSAAMGGALFVSSSLGATISDTDFTSNQATTAGGAVYMLLGDMTFSDVSFEANKASVEGGGLFNEGGVAAINDSHFSQGSALVGAAIAGQAQSPSFPSSLLVDRSSFTDNVAANLGGAVWLSDSEEVQITQSNFCANSAASGGSLYLDSGSSFEISNSSFVENAAQVAGGDLFLKDYSDARIHHNAAVFSSLGSFWLELSTVDFIHNVIADSSGAEAVYSSGATLVSDYNAYFRNDGGHSNQALGAGSLDNEDPLLTRYSADGDCTNDDLSPKAGSPLIDAGDPSLSLDLDGSTADIGVRGGAGAALDWDLDGSEYPDDCDDLEAAIFPGSLAACDGVDSDCDGLLELDEDTDQDGYAAISCGGDDCDDGLATVHPGAAAVCDGLDNDCDGLLESADDRDGDGELDTTCGGTDCDDNDGAISSLASELCDGVDNDCDGTIDEAGALDGIAYVEDIDQDGFGSFAIADMASGPYNNCSLAVNGRVDCWGNDSYGINDSPSGDFVSVSVGDYHACALDLSGAIVCWTSGGSVDQGQASPPTGSFEQVGAGRYHSCARDSLGAIACWGLSDGSGLDFGQVSDAPTGSGFLDLSVGLNHACAIDATSELVCWGHDADGQSSPPTGAHTEIAAGVADSCAIDDLGELACWGASAFVPAAGSYTRVSVGKSVACAETTTGEWSCFGEASSLIVASIPQNGLSHVVLGDQHACGLNRALGLICWGADPALFGLIDNRMGATELYCAAPSGDWVTDRTDCVADEAAVYPGADEYCDGLDNDCDDATDEVGSVDGTTAYPDDDLDGFGDATDSGERYCTVPAGLVTENTDCEDSDGASYPGASELCDSQDNDCDGEIDEVGSLNGTLYYVDLDGDGFGDQSDIGALYCSQPAGWVADNSDCDDTDSSISPDQFDHEICDGVDNDCDGDVDSADSIWDQSTGVAGYIDSDLDGYGDGSQPTAACDFGSGIVADASDCDDSDASVHPNQSEDCATNFDDNCDGYFSDCDGADNDGDGYCGSPRGELCDDPSDLPGDCDDTDPARYPYAPITCTSTDNDCDGVLDEVIEDVDGDGFTPVGACAGSKDDCNDNLDTVFPGATEQCNGLDDDCNGAVDDDPNETLNFVIDLDGDGYAAAGSCNLAIALVDCDDGDASIHPGAIEDLSNSRDDDCDGYIVDPVNVDNDRDGYCEGSDGSLCVSDVFVKGVNDCDDADPARAPDKDEIQDGIDNDCDGFVDNDNKPGEVDGDGDGYCPNSQECTAGSGLLPGDCDDFDPAVHPDAVEQCNGRDDNCDGLIWLEMDERDLDGDGVFACSDCDDLDDAIYPGQAENCSDQIDNDCDGFTDQIIDKDGDGYYTCFDDCNDASADAFQGAEEICDGVDNDCDGVVDEGFDADQDGYFDCMSCSGFFPAPLCDCDDNNALTRPRRGEDCTDGIDNNCDGFVDLGGDQDWDNVDRCDGDCDDFNPEVNPLKPEVCDGVDNNCDGEVDETFDRDGDGVYSCFGDCEDDPDVGGEYAHAGLDEDDPEDCDELDNDCNGVVDDLWPDSDLDGYTECQGDCDNEAGISSPGDLELCDDSVDNDCDGDVDELDLDCVLDDTGDMNDIFEAVAYRPGWFCGVSKRAPGTPWAVVFLLLATLGRRRVEGVVSPPPQ
jgi:hypothetical protein